MYLKLEDLKDITDAILNAPCVGVLIYQEKIVYANEFFLKLTGYTEEEIKNLSVLDLIDESEDKKTLEEVVKRRLKGEKFLRVYQELKIKTKEGKIRVLLTFANTITYQEKPSGFVILIDVTRQKKIEKLLAMLREVNQIITGSLFEEEIFEKICKNLVEKIGLRFVWVGFPDFDEKRIKPKYWYGFEEGYLKKIWVSLDPSLPEGRGPVGTAFRKGEVIVISDTRNDPRFSPWKEEAIKRGYLSVAGVPIFKAGKPYCVLALYSDEPQFFDEQLIKILEELKLDLEFALKRVEEIRESFIISESLKKTPLWVFLLDKKGRIVYMNEKVKEITNLSEEYLLGSSLEVLNFISPLKDFSQELTQILETEKAKTEFVIYKGLGEKPVYLELSFFPISYLDVKQTLVIGKDITSEIELKEKLERILSCDILTETYNLKGIEEVFNDLVKKEERLLFVLLDVCDFSYFNKAYGFDFSDKILVELAKVLKFFEKDVQVGRVGGDEFILIFKRESENLPYLYKRLENLKELSLEIEGKRITLFLNLGIVLFPEDGSDFKSLFEKCSAALKESKKLGKSCIKFFDQKTELEVYENVVLELLIKRALEDKLFRFYFQPYFRGKDLSLAGVEALVRMEERGVIADPKIFIQHLEKSPYLRKFEEWMLEEIERKLKIFKVPISINISVNTFFNKDFIDELIERVGKSGYNLKVEITERIFLEDFNLVKDRFYKLRENNISIVIDDFGKGYSSLNYILNVPVDIIKIDMGFVQKTDVSEKHRAVFEIIVELCNRLKIETVAEGVETEEQLDIVRKAGCTYVQGFLLERPLSEEELIGKYPFIVAGVAE